ncbi:hypothetical protein EV207_1083 [Scopulibacillus darangshiensis]|uniref:MFS transporter n=1 Tax=Scopulibacillus darangshiensis TaxID=442528 RepID=A0A4R2P4M9_9BACL|nr:hypothetical protein [Scopulibacillus darangshiensis]TCP29712.1 hypothetical protein EV207_1083 [Scopulibacillus darangshiensis]
MNQYKKDFIEGYHVVKKQTTLLTILFGVIGMNVFGSMGIAMLPVISTSPSEYGFWLTAMSVGTLSGTLLSGKVENIPLNRIMHMVSLFSGVCWILSFVTMESFLIPYILFGLSWMGIGILAIYAQTLIQVNLPGEYLGIGFAFLSSLLGSLTPIGYFLGGLLGDLSSGFLILLLSGTGYIGFAIYFMIHPKLSRLKNRLSVSFEHGI